MRPPKRPSPLSDPHFLTHNFTYFFTQSLQNSFILKTYPFIFCFTWKGAYNVQTPAALFIARQLIQDADLEDRIEAESARIEDCKGEPLCEEGKNALEAAGFPVTPEVPIPLEWKTYDNYNLILLVDNPDNPALFNTMGGDVDNKIHLLSDHDAGGDAAGGELRTLMKRAPSPEPSRPPRQPARASSTSFQVG